MLVRRALQQTPHTRQRPKKVHKNHHEPTNAPSSSSADTPPFDGPALVDALMRLLRLKTTPIAMKMFERVEDMEAVPRIRRPSHIHTADPIVGQAARIGQTVGITATTWWGANAARYSASRRAMKPFKKPRPSWACGSLPLKTPLRTRARCTAYPTDPTRPWPSRP